MSSTRRQFLATASATVGSAAIGRAADVPQLEAGTAKVEITPPVGQPMGGFLSRLKVKGGACEDIHDPLFARVLFLQSGTTSLAIVTVDLLFFSSRRLIAEAKAKWNIDHVILSSTHTHAGPIPKTGGLPEWSNLNVNPQETLDFEAFSKDPWSFLSRLRAARSLRLSGRPWNRRYSYLYLSLQKGGSHPWSLQCLSLFL